MSSRNIAITTRAVTTPDTGESRDALARDWPVFLDRALGRHRWMTLPNTGAPAVEIAKRWGLDALLLTGGDDWGVFPERDATETALYHWARENHLPIIGICRGAQVITLLEGGTLAPAQQVDHVGTRHKVTFSDATTATVNSYHGNTIPAQGLPHSLKALAHAPDKTIEAFTGTTDGALLGLMWHPEREPEPNQRDVDLMSTALEDRNV